MASKGINKVIIVGNLGNDPEVRFTPNGSAVTKISIATSESWKDKNSGQTKDKTEWHNVVFFGKLAEIAGEYLKKGSQVYIEGKLKTDKYQDKASGQDRYSTNIVVDSFSGVLQMLSSKDGHSQAKTQQNTSQGEQPSRVNPPQRTQKKPQQNDFNDDFNDDLPF